MESTVTPIKFVDHKLTTYINWIKTEAVKMAPLLTTADNNWVNEQVVYRYGRAYYFVINKKWKDLLPDIKDLPSDTKLEKKPIRWLKSTDITAAAIRLAYNTWGEYRHEETIAHIIVHNMLRLKTDANLLLPICLVDIMGHKPVPYWTYNRLVGTFDHILWPLCSHTLEYRPGLSDNMMWKDKKPILIFRGATTGYIQRYLVKECNKMKSSRYDILKQWANQPWADFGFNKILPRTKTEKAWKTHGKHIMALLKPKMTMEQLLHYRFILCIEGNDVSTSFGWVLASNSVPIHPYPFIYEVWYFNGLKPYVHFIPCKLDGSDLDKQMTWAINHDDVCRKIAQNGRDHMAKMLDPVLYVEVLRRMYNMWDLHHPNENN